MSIHCDDIATLLATAPDYHAYHSIERAWERYQLQLTVADLAEMSRWIRESCPRAVYCQSLSGSARMHAVRVSSRWMAACYRSGQIVTFLPNGSLNRHRRLLREHKVKHGIGEGETKKKVMEMQPGYQPIAILYNDRDYLQNRWTGCRDDSVVSTGSAVIVDPTVSAERPVNAGSAVSTNSLGCPA